MFSFKGKWRECFIYYTTMDDGDDGRWMMDDGRRTMDDDDGRWTMDDGRQTTDVKRFVSSQQAKVKRKYNDKWVDYLSVPTPG